MPEQLLDDLDSETKELTASSTSSSSRPTDRRDDEPAEDCDLESLSEQAAARVRRRMGREIAVVGDGSMVSCRPSAIDRAVVNVIDNAAKFSVAGLIEVTVERGRLAVSDRGPGIPVR